jgi:hypothetical protein
MSEQRRSISVVARSTAPAQLLAVAMSIAACASNAPRYPQQLRIGQVGQVAEICQQVMGFQPTEPLFDSLWPGDPYLDLATNNYRGCIASLSNSLERVLAVRNDRLAVDDCRANGLETGASDLGTCVLRTVESTSGLAAPEPVSLLVTPFRETPWAAYSSASFWPLRERLACAEIGLEPSQPAFDGCVQGLRDVLSANAMSAFYRNQ